MLVREAYENLKKLVKQGKGDCIIMGIDCRSDDSAEGSIYSTVKKVTGEETAGELCDMDVGTEYVPLYIG